MNKLVLLEFQEIIKKRKISFFGKQERAYERTNRQEGGPVYCVLYEDEVKQCKMVARI